MRSYHRAVYTVLSVLCGVSFIGFGIGYLVSPRMRGEFVRYHLPRLRVPAACMQIAGGAGQLVGLYAPWLMTAASAGLAAMMLVAIGVRVSIGDSIVQMLPATGYLVLCLYLLRASLGR